MTDKKKPTTSFKTFLGTLCMELQEHEALMKEAQERAEQAEARAKELTELLRKAEELSGIFKKQIRGEIDTKNKRIAELEEKLQKCTDQMWNAFGDPNTERPSKRPRKED